MANPQPDRYTRLANELLEQVPRFKLNGTQLRIILVIWRYTYGFQRKEHSLSVGFIAEAMEASKSQVDRELTALIERNVITVVADRTGKPRVIRFNKDYSSWNPRRRPRNGGQSQGVLQNAVGVTAKTSTDPTAKTRSKKERKKTLKKGYIDMPPNDDPKLKFLDTVLLTQEEYDRLINDFGKDTVDLYIEKLDEWQTNNPKKQKKDHNKTLRVWIKGDLARKRSGKNRNDAQMDILNEFYEEGRRLETDGNGQVLGGDQNRLP